jgi:hypothetical protein
VVDTHGGPEAFAQRLEELPGYLAGVVLEHEVPLLCRAGHVEGGQPHLVCFASVLRAEELLAMVEPSGGVFLPIKHGEQELVVEWYRGALLLVVVLFVLLR